MSLTCSIHFGGSRSLLPSWGALVRQVVQAVQAAGAVVHVGCAAGADQAVSMSASPAGLRVFAQFAPSGQGAFSGSSVRAVRQAAAAGASVSWLAGGPLSLPLGARLARRSQAALAGCAASVFFLAAPASHGSLSVAAHAAAAGQQVLAFSCGFSGPPAALAGQAGSWLPAQFAGSSCWQWQPAVSQLALF
jgi:predicted Rossmann fold nucleotide-binding protein DprA/Smf involved in DNA uptake